MIGLINHKNKNSLLANLFNSHEPLKSLTSTLIYLLFVLPETDKNKKEEIVQPWKKHT